MRSVHDQLREDLLFKAGMGPPPYTVQELWHMQWSKRFERWMRARLVMGFFRYGSNRETDRTARPRRHNIRSAIKRLELYLETGNQECLVDAANLCMVEALIPGDHPSPFFGAVDDGIHTEEAR